MDEPVEQRLAVKALARKQPCDGKPERERHDCGDERDPKRQPDGHPFVGRELDHLSRNVKPCASKIARAVGERRNESINTRARRIRMRAALREPDAARMRRAVTGNLRSSRAVIEERPIRKRRSGAGSRLRRDQDRGGQSSLSAWKFRGLRACQACPFRVINSGAADSVAPSPRSWVRSWGRVIAYGSAAGRRLHTSP